MASDLPPGPELDALVAEKVMGAVEVVKMGRGGNKQYARWGFKKGSHQVLRYSTDWAAAGEVLEKLRPHGSQLICWQETEQGGYWSATLVGEDDSLGEAHGKTGPHAISLAALAAKEREGE